MTDTKGLTRVEGGWLARHYWGKPDPISEYFYDHTFGGREQSEAAANRWLAGMAHEYPAPKGGRKPIMGEVMDSYGERGAGFYVSWTEWETGIQRKVEFPISKYGDNAERVAKQFLAERQREFDEQ